MAREVKGDHLADPFLLAFQRLIDGDSHHVGSLRSGNDPLGLGKVHRRGEGGSLMYCSGLDAAVIVEGGNTGRHAMVSQTTGMDPWRYKGVSHCETLFRFPFSCRGEPLHLLAPPDPLIASLLYGS